MNKFYVVDLRKKVKRAAFRWNVAKKRFGIDKPYSIRYYVYLSIVLSKSSRVKNRKIKSVVFYNGLVKLFLTKNI